MTSTAQALGLLLGIIVVAAWAAICWGRAYVRRFGNQSPEELLCEWYAKRRARRERAMYQPRDPSSLSDDSPRDAA